MPDRRRFYLVFNPLAGTARFAAVDRLIAALEANGASVQRAPTGSLAEVTAAAAEAASSGHYDALIACGGDGTVRQIAIAAARTACPVGAYMLGTGNILAHELNLPREPASLAHSFMTADALSIPMARANGEPFLLVAGAGYDGRVVAALDQPLKQRIAKLAYVPASLTALLAPLDTLRVTIDGQTSERARWVIVTRASCYGGAFRLTKRVSLHRPGLLAIMFQAERRMDLIRHNIDIALGRLDRMAELEHMGVVMKSAENVLVETTSPTPAPVQVDGDQFGTTPLFISTDGPVVQIIGPGRDP